MAFTKAEKNQIVSQFQRHKNDTASVEVQVAIITYRLQYLSSHFDKNPKDKHSKTGLLKMVGKRRRLLDYLKSKDFGSYKKLIATLGLRK